MIKVLVIGDAILDHYVYGEIERQSPEDPTIPVVDILNEEYRLGGCLNVAANIKSISFSWKKNVPRFDIFLSSIFSPFTGKKIERAGIRSDGACITPSETWLGTIHCSNNELIKTRIINSTTHKQILRIDNRKTFKYEDIKLFEENLMSNYNSNYDAIVVSDYCKGLINNTIIKKLEDFTNLVLVDTKHHDLSIWKNIKSCIVKINNNEFNKSKNAETIENLIVTRSSRSTQHFKYGKLHEEYPVNPVKDPEVTGAGDVFLAAFAVQYLRTKKINEAIVHANAMAEKSVKLKGTSQVTP